MYINHELRWGIELIVSGSDIDTHIHRFSPEGRYHALDVDDYIIVDFGSDKVQSVGKYPKKLSVLFREDFSACKCIFEDCCVEISLDE